MKKAHYDNQTNRLLGWYDDKMHKTIPTPNIEVSNKEWEQALFIGANYIEGRNLIVKDFRTPIEIEDQKEQEQWNIYKKAEESDKKEKWKQSGNPTFKAIK